MSKGNGFQKTSKPAAVNVPKNRRTFSSSILPETEDTEEWRMPSLPGSSRRRETATSIRKDKTTSGASGTNDRTKESAVSSGMDKRSQRRSINGIARGLQIRAYNTNDLSKGFPYPTSLISFEISHADWEVFQHELVTPILQWHGQGVGVSPDSKSCIK
jgi:hypothetical protein